MLKRLIASFLPLALWGEILSFSTLTANFTQSVVAPGGKKIIYTGTIALKQPNSAYWGYTKPVPKEIFVNGHEVIIHEPRLKQVTWRRMDESLNLGTLLKKAVRVNEGVWRASHDGIDATITVENNLPKTLFFTDKNGYQITIELNEIKLNPTIPVSRFSFTPPEGYDIIR
ncbi:MAG: LolA-like outer membrane lipoprotein chaperone [Campylobacterales bacterium]